MTPKLIFMTALVLVAFFYAIFNFLILYHLTRFGVGVKPKRVALVFFLGSVVLCFFSVIFFVNLDVENLKTQFVKLEQTFWSVAYSNPINLNK